MQSGMPVDILAQPDASDTANSEKPGMVASIFEQSALDSSVISDQPGVILGVDAQLLAVITDTLEQPTMADAHVSEQPGVGEETFCSAIQSDDILCVISSPAATYVRSDGAVTTRSVGAVSSHLKVHAYSAGSEITMSTVVRPADVSSSNVFSSKASDVHCDGRSDVSVSNDSVQPSLLIQDPKTDADHVPSLTADAVFEMASAFKVADACSVLIIGAEEFIS